MTTQEARFESQYLLSHVLDCDRAWLISHAENHLSAEQYGQFLACIERRVNGEPIAYILGYREFYGLPLQVSQDTLIPRPDTETLVETLMTCIQDNWRELEQPSILDLGTGSGAIALAIASLLPKARITAIDASPEALVIANKNAASLKITNVRFLESDWFSALEATAKFHIIVSNPPYIADNDPHLVQGDLRFEPRSALVSGHDGLDDIRYLISHCTPFMHDGAWIMLEHGYNQSSSVAQLLRIANFQNIGHAYDLQAIPRVTFGQWRAGAHQTV